MFYHGLPGTIKPKRIEDKPLLMASYLRHVYHLHPS